MKKIMGTKKLLFVLMAILIPLGTLQIPGAKAYYSGSGRDFVDFKYDADVNINYYKSVRMASNEGNEFIPLFDDAFVDNKHDADADIDFYKSVRITPNREFKFNPIDVGLWYDVKGVTKVKSSSKKLSVRKGVDSILYVKASEEGTYTIKYTVEFTHYKSGKKRTYTGTTTVYVYDYPFSEVREGRRLITNSISYCGRYLKIYMNGKMLEHNDIEDDNLSIRRISWGLISDIPEGRLTAKLDKSYKGITITKIKVYGRVDKGGKRTSIKNAKKGKKVYLNTHHSIGDYQRKRLNTGVRVFYKDKYTGVTRTEFFTIEYKK